MVGIIMGLNDVTDVYRIVMVVGGGGSTVGLSGVTDVVLLQDCDGGGGRPRTTGQGHVTRRQKLAAENPLLRRGEKSQRRRHVSMVDFEYQHVVVVLGTWW